MDDLTNIVEAARGELAAAASLSELDAVRVRYLGRWLRYGAWNPDWVLRLFRRDAGHFTPDRVHERVQVSGPTGHMRGVLRHYSFRDLAHHAQKMNEMSSLAAAQMAERGRRASWAQMTLLPGWEFLRAYVLKRGFLDGAPGLVAAKMHAQYVFAKYAKLREQSGAGGQ